MGLTRALTPTEQVYAPIEKETLAVVFGCQRFHKLIYGMPEVTIESDHKPLQTLFKKPIIWAPMRIQRMMLKLQPYSFKLVYAKRSSIGLVDCLSRLPHTGDETFGVMDDELMVCNIDTRDWHICRKNPSCHCNCIIWWPTVPIYCYVHYYNCKP